eukprot:2727118-Rhodomonas_salina.1
MDSDFFISTLEALILTNNKFNFFVNHPAPDDLTPGPALDAFKKSVINYLVAHGLVFPIDKMMKGIQAQLSSACIASMETIFTTEVRRAVPAGGSRYGPSQSRH